MVKLKDYTPLQQQVGVVSIGQTNRTLEHCLRRAEEGADVGEDGPVAVAEHAVDEMHVPIGMNQKSSTVIPTTAKHVHIGGMANP